VPAHEQKMRAAGLTDYRVWPLDPPRGEYAAVAFIDPLDWRNERALGFDMLSEDKRRAALERARDTNEPTLSEIVRLVQETEVDAQPGLLLFVPLYRTGEARTAEERRAEPIGYPYSPSPARDLF